jgi:hypothetical protein
MMGFQYRGTIMSDPVSAPATLNDRRFTDMGAGEKVVFLAKAIVFFVSGGFIYPTLWVD